MPASLPSQVVISPDVLSADMDSSDAVLLNINSGTYFSLSPVAAYLWKLWTNNGSVQTSIDRLTHDYAVDPTTAQLDVAELIGALEQDGLISIPAQM